MAQFDVYRLEDGTRIVDAQSPLASIHSTRFVIPLIEPDTDADRIDRLNPVFEIGETRWLLAIHFASTIDARLLRSPIASLAHEDIAIKDSIDFLINGF